MIELLKSVPASVRRWVYAAYAVLVFLAGCIQVGYSTTGEGQPTWLLVALNVLAYAGGALGINAAINAGNPGPPPVPGDNQHVRGQRGMSQLTVVCLVAAAVTVLVVFVVLPLIRS